MLDGLTQLVDHELIVLDGADQAADGADTAVADQVTLASHDTLAADTRTTIDLVLIDGQLSDRAILVQSVLPGTQWLLYDSTPDSTHDVLAAVSQWADASHVRLDSLSILSHATPGALALGNQWITADTLDATAADWKRLTDVLAEGANIQLFGCNLADDTGPGQQLLDQLAQLTGADLFASSNLTGDGGDWVLEVASSGARGTGRRSARVARHAAAGLLRSHAGLV